MTLRDYQERDVQRLREELRQHQSCLYVAPCGSGKGTLITFIVNRCVQQGKRVIFAVHGKALVHDMSARVSRLGIKHGVLMGSMPRQRWHSVQVASIDTLHRMEHPPEAAVIIVDEAHMSLSPTWRKVLERYSSAKVIGMTATPIRLDKQGLGRKSGGLFDSMVLGPTEKDLIAQGYLVKSRVLAPPPPEGLREVRKVAGEYNPKQQVAMCDKPKIVGDIVGHWRKHAANRKTAAFGIDQAHANHITEGFRAAGIPWAYVDAETPDRERDRIWRDLDDDSGGLMGVSSVGCISVGWDHPVVSCLISARKTASLGLWKQMLGRGSRPYRGKDHFLVLDHVGNTHEHWPYGMFEDEVPWALDGPAIKEREEDKAEPITTCKKSVWVGEKFFECCFATFKSGPKECPYCGCPITVTPKSIQVVAGELREVAERREEGSGEHNERIVRKIYEALQSKAEKKGYKPGYADGAFSRMYGFMPSPAWKEGREA